MARFSLSSRRCLDCHEPVEAVVHDFPESLYLDRWDTVIPAYEPAVTVLPCGHRRGTYLTNAESPSPSRNA